MEAKMRLLINIGLSLWLLFFTSCVSLYKPHVIHSPLLKEKGQLNTSGSVAAFGSGLYNLQSAYAIQDNIGLTFDLMSHIKNNKSTDSQEFEKYRIYAGNLGAGYFSVFGSENKGLFQSYSGIGIGATSDKIYNYPNYTPNISSKYFDAYLQPGIAHVGKNVEYAFDVRTSFVHVYDIHSYLYEQFEWWNTEYTYYNDTTFNFINVEPTFTLKVGSKNLKGIFQMGFTIPVYNYEQYFASNNTVMMFGTIFKLSAGLTYTFRFKNDQEIKPPVINP